MAACKAMLDAARRRARQQHGHGDGAQRRQLRHPPERHRRRVVPGAAPIRSTGCTSRATPSTTPPPTSATRAITETNGLGGFAMAASPAIVQFVGGTPADATANSRRDAVASRSGAIRRSRCRRSNFGGTPAGIDARRGGRFRRAADHQHRHRAPGGRRGPDRRRHHDGADGVLRRRRLSLAGQKVGDAE